VVIPTVKHFYPYFIGLKQVGSASAAITSILEPAITGLLTSIILSGITTLIHQSSKKEKSRTMKT